MDRPTQRVSIDRHLDSTETLNYLEETTMGKRARQRKDRKKKGANHGKRPNA